MKLDQILVDAAIDLLDKRFPNSEGIAAALYISDGQTLTSVVFDPEWGGGGLCAEAGAILEAHKLNKTIIAIACVSRLAGNAPVVILTPCGICQERLFHWGGENQVAAPRPDDPTRWVARKLKEIQPYYWADVFRDQKNPFK